MCIRDSFQPHAEKRHTFTQLLFFLLCQPVQPAALSGGKREVFLNGHAGRAAAHRVLKEPADLLRALVFGGQGDVFPIEDDIAGVGDEAAGNRAEERRLSRAVRADEDVYKRQVLSGLLPHHYSVRQNG